MSLSVTVHRGTHQIGGTCIEICHTSGERLILDAGMPLDAPGGAENMLPKTLDLTRPATVLISHAHQDHWGVLHETPSDWPVWTGPISAKLIRLGYEMNGTTLQHQANSWNYDGAFDIGPFHVTPYLTDHSAPDAAMLLIEADGQRIVYSGDFRTHGRKGSLVQKFMDNPPEDIDLLIMEGTNLGTTKPVAPETEIEDRFAALLDQVPGRVFTYWSAQNVDRTVSLFRAVRKRRRKLFVDLYTAEVMDLVAPGTRLPRIVPDFHELQLVVTSRQRRVRGKNPINAEATDTLINRCKETGQAISARQLPKNAVVMTRGSSIGDFEKAGIFPGPDDVFVFSSWAGYEDTIAAKTFEWMRKAGARIEHIHTSGHASPHELRALVKAVSPRHVLPVHGENWDQDHDGFPDLLRLSDGDIYSLPGKD